MWYGQQCLILTTFWFMICDLLLNRCTATRNLFDNKTLLYIFSPFITCLQCPWKLITFFFHTGHFNFEFFFSLYTFDVVLHFPLCFLNTFLQCFHFAVNKVADTTELTNCVIFWHLPDFCREGVLGNESFHHSAEKKVSIWTKPCLISARTYSNSKKDLYRFNTQGTRRYKLFIFIKSRAHNFAHKKKKQSSFARISENEWTKNIKTCNFEGYQFSFDSPETAHRLANSRKLNSVKCPEFTSFNKYASLFIVKANDKFQIKTDQNTSQANMASMASGFQGASVTPSADLLNSNSCVVIRALKCPISYVRWRPSITEFFVMSLHDGR